MKRGKKFLPFMLLFSSVILLLILIMQPVTVILFRHNIDMLFPKGEIALQQRNLLLVLQALMLLVVVPVYILTFIFSWRYRAYNTKAVYDPDLVDNRIAEYIWWGIPLVMTAIAAVLTFVKTYELDPYKPIESERKAMTIQVVALQWKWLFIYPEEKIATTNLFQFPEQTPIHFEITSDAPMNSFWIPRLGGQIYAMPKMKTELYLIANEKGDFKGSSANLSGEGFAGMTFIARASSEEDYQQWIKEAKESEKQLDFKKYEELAKPSQNNSVEIFSLNDNELFNAIMMKYMQPQRK